MEITLIILIAINSLIFIAPYLLPFIDGNIEMTRNFLFFIGQKSNIDISKGEYYRLLTSNYLHVNFLHLAVNMYSLWILGKNVKAFYNTPAFIFIYILSGIGGSFFSYRFNPSPSVGASGAIFGLIGALLAIAVHQRHTDMFSELGYLILVNLVIAFLPGMRIDNWGHIGGLFTGFSISYVFYMLNLGLKIRR
jgi:rhomboid protease GluP